MDYEIRYAVRCELLLVKEINIDNDYNSVVVLGITLKEINMNCDYNSVVVLGIIVMHCSTEYCKYADTCNFQFSDKGWVVLCLECDFPSSRLGKSFWFLVKVCL